MKDVMLKHCPFCGSKNQIVGWFFVDGNIPIYYIECCGCGVHTDIFYKKQEAYDAWNKRASGEVTVGVD